MKDLRALMNDVASDDALKARFQTASQREDCVDMLIQYAHAKGYPLSASDVGTMLGGGAVGRRLSASELAGVVGGKNCYWFDNSSGCSAGSCSQFSFY